MRQIRFGTDGVRGPYGEWPLTERGAHVIGRAVGLWANSGRVVVGRAEAPHPPLSLTSVDLPCIQESTIGASSRRKGQ